MLEGAQLRHRAKNPSDTHCLRGRITWAQEAVVEADGPGFGGDDRQRAGAPQQDQ